MALLLAPMEGLLDYALRDVLTRIGGIDRCVSEFIRVTGTLLPERAFLRVVPELANGSRTAAGTPVRPQLLGSDAACLAENAARLAEMGAEGIDLNFGCPAKVVNRHGGGAALLRDPDLLHHIVASVRKAVPAHTPVSAKMRLGYDDASRAEECARGIAEAGAQELVVHARTRADGYRPPAYWDRVAAVRAVVSIPVVANGEIWSAADAQRCREVSGCQDLMLGRGMVSDPGLAWAIRRSLGEANAQVEVTWPALQPALWHYWTLVVNRVEPRARAGRIKQWLHYLKKRHPEAASAFDAVRTINDSRAMQAWLHQGLEGSGSEWCDQTTPDGI